MRALEYGFGCEILSPQSIRDEMRNAAAGLMKMYGQEVRRICGIIRL